MPKQKSYKQLLADLKKELIPMARREAVAELLMKLSTDTNGVPIKMNGEIHELLAALFRTKKILGLSIVSVVSKEAPPIAAGSPDRIVTVVAGKPPEAAFHVQAMCENGQISVYFWQVTP